MEEQDYEKAKKEITKLSNSYTKQQKKAFDAEKTLSEYVEDIIVTYGLENDLTLLNEIIKLLPDCIYRFSLAERYIGLKNQANRNE